MKWLSRIKNIPKYISIGPGWVKALGNLNRMAVHLGKKMHDTFWAVSGFVKLSFRLLVAFKG